MIDLKCAHGEHVHIQFKRGLLYVGSLNGHMGPLSSGPTPRNPDGSVDTTKPPAPPIITDQMSGKLRVVEDQLILTYPNPTTEGEYLNMFIDPDNIAAAWTIAPVVIASLADVSHTG